jgi:hypothetical protein
MNGAMFPFTVRDTNEVAAVVAAVNQGIDSHFEACNMPDESDGYTPDGRGLDCIVSEHSLPVLLPVALRTSWDVLVPVAVRSALLSVMFACLSAEFLVMVVAPVTALPTMSIACCPAPIRSAPSH